MNAENREPKLPFMKAYMFLMNKENLTSAEKLVLIVVCRFWPNPYWDSNGEIAKALGFTERYVEKLVKSLADKRIIKRGYTHIDRKRRPHTVRVIVPRCFPKIPGYQIKWVKTEQMDGEQPEHTDGPCPNSGSLLPEQSDDLLDENKQGNREATPTPLPAGGQAPALLKKKAAGKQKHSPKLTPAEREQRRQHIQRQVEQMISQKNDKKSQ